jgi:hypothetical protein
MRRRCEALVDSLDLSGRVDLANLSSVLGKRRGRPIHLLPLKLPVSGPCGMWVATGTYDAVFFEKNTSLLHQHHIVAHEFGHILADHRMEHVLGSDASRLLLPDLDPALVRRFLGRTNYTEDEEREAEVIASLLVRRMAQDDGLNPSPPGELGRLSHSLEHSRRDADG